MPKKEKKLKPMDDPSHPMYRARPRENGSSKGKIKISRSFTPKPKIKEPKRLSNTKGYETRMRSRGKNVDDFSAGGIVKVAKTLINKYKPKIKNQKEDYGLYSKQDYSDVIKNYEKTQKKKQRNRKVAGTVGGATAATVVASNVKDKK